MLQVLLLPRVCSLIFEIEISDLRFSHPPTMTLKDPRTTLWSLCECGKETGTLLEICLIMEWIHSVHIPPLFGVLPGIWPSSVACVYEDGSSIPGLCPPDNSDVFSVPSLQRHH